MAVRRESKVIQCHSKDEQSEIDFMQRFYWNLQSTQTVHSIDSHTERRGENLYSVTESIRYVKLHFSRGLDTPHLDKIKKLEDEYSRLPIPKFPKLFPGGWVLWLLLFIFSFGILIFLWVAYLVFVYSLKRSRAQREYEQYQINRHEILERMEYIDQLPDDEDNLKQSKVKPLLKSSTN